MFELLSYLVYIFLMIIVSRSCAVIAARRLREKSPSEAFLASIEVLPSREMSDVQDAVAACYAVLKESKLGGWPARFAIIHVGSWLLFGIMIVVMAAVGLVRGL